jgi:tetratricopeptide (TPR) repeat protein
VRFVCASSLKKNGRDTEALRQVLALLQEEHADGTGHRETLAYWQRRAGNEIANRFYQEGDLMKALDIYLSLAALDASPEWQLPVWYQVGLVFERLDQPAKATEYYVKIGHRENEVAANAPPSLKAVLEMARWRKNFLAWQINAETAKLKFDAVVGASRTNASAVQLLPPSL